MLTNMCRRHFAARATQGSLTKNQIPKERFMNRAEWMANKYKDNSDDTYDWVPEIMTTIDPAPRYFDGGRNRGGIRENKRRRGIEAMDAVRNASINLSQKRERARVGRLMAHVKHIEMRN